MTSLDGFRRVPALIAACFATVLATSGAARADVISSTATLPLLGDTYSASVGAGCFAAVGVCVTGGTLTLTTPVSSAFDLGGQDIVTGVVYAATLTTLGNTPIGSVILTGSVEQQVLGRTTSTETGSWTTDLVSLLLTGPALGHTLTMTLDPSNTSSGTTSITPNQGSGFTIGSFFDVFTDLTLDSTPPLNTSRGPILFNATAAPEPASLTLFGLPVLLLLAGRRSQTT